MRGVSAATLEEVLAAVEGSGTSDIGDELFSVTALLDATPSLRRILTDPATEPDARVGLLKQVLGDKVSTGTLAILTVAANGRWASSRDLTDGLEISGVAAHVAAAEKDGQLEAMESELFDVGNIVVADSDLRAALTDRTTAASAKAELVNSIFEGKVTAPTVALVRQAAAARTASFEKVLATFADEVADRRNRLLAEVRSTYPLTDAELDRIAAALAKRYDREFHLNTVIDPDLVGGIRVSVGGDVIDGSVSSRLEDARRLIAG
ncbi:F-type H+-transporting ATPase subunit delta [Aeromicrobium panaciterrae]|uniref:ATP synthase subunit delta n=1 Tax=Aeromicrobium panaciterrae TaxID=363861 RepID=A0ABU1UMM7_9ACTN|nr:F0F1 ATP synthase subunit delta [Aeromicrobium panaciterrae]MDR7086431.1 F-type H+-transporting ATPase subunit delta [Aeromicrobium panaciterrae]